MRRVFLMQIEPLERLCFVISRCFAVDYGGKKRMVV